MEDPFRIGVVGKYIGLEMGMVRMLVFEVAMKEIGDAFLALVRAQNRAAGGTNRSQKLYRYIWSL
jgi:hypothetical protein